MSMSDLANALLPGIARMVTCRRSGHSCPWEHNHIVANVPLIKKGGKQNGNVYRISSLHKKSARGMLLCVLPRGFDSLLARSWSGQSDTAQPIDTRYRDVRSVRFLKPRQLGWTAGLHF